MRQAELLGLKWEDLDWERRSLQVHRQLVKTKGVGFEFTEPKTRSGRRTILLGKSTLEILRQHRLDQDAGHQSVEEGWNELALIFPDEDGTPMERRKLVSSFKDLIKEASLPEIRFHDLRHTAASLMLNNGIPILIVSRRLGHAKASITLDVYWHLIPSKQEEVAELMDTLLTPIEVENCSIFAPGNTDFSQNEV